MVAASIASALAFVVLLLWYGRRMSEAILPGMSAVRTTSMAIVSIRLTDPTTGEQLQMRIPKAYLVRAENWRGGDQNIVVVETRLSELMPAVASPAVEGIPGSAEHGKSLGVFNNGISAYLDNDRVDPTIAAQNIYNRLSNIDRRKGDPLAYELISDDYYGLERYKELRCHVPGAIETGVPDDSTEQCSDSATENYFYKSDDSPFVHITCNLTHRDAVGVRQGCDAYSSYRGYSFHYRIRYSQLNRWKEFDSGVRKLFDRFIA